MKVLIWTKHIEFKNSGGPSGYLYNIREYLKDHPSDMIDFYPVEYKPIEKDIPKGGWKLALRILIKRLASPIRFYQYMKENYLDEVPLTDEDMKLIDQYDYVHVHYLSHIRQSFMHFNNGHTKIILTTHNPEPLVDQLADEKGMAWSLKCIPFLRNYFLRKEIEAYGVADYVMYPVEQAREPYINRSELYKEAFIKMDRENKFFYVPTALDTTSPCNKNNHVIDKYNIPFDALKLCYVGRHNEVKGYDTIRNMAEKVWEKIPNAYFIIGGKEEPLKGLKDNRWIELGWVHTHSLLNEVDAFILPNKDTYFDLILLEVLRQGNPVILTRTGGNKWFEGKGFDHLYFYETGDVNNFVNHCVSINQIKKEGLLSEAFKNTRDAYACRLSMDKYISNYLKQLSEL